MASRSTRRQRFDVICVGDVATDVFITLSPDQVEVRGEAGEPTLVIPFGAKLPYESVATVPAGGNAANAAVACARLGLHVALAAFVGADQLGRDAVAALNAEGVDTSLVHLDQQTPTNSDFVLRLGQERTILVRHAQHDYHWPHLRPSEVPAWLYLSSVGRAGVRTGHLPDRPRVPTPRPSLPAGRPDDLQPRRGGGHLRVPARRGHGHAAGRHAGPRPTPGRHHRRRRRGVRGDGGRALLG